MAINVMRVGKVDLTISGAAVKDTPGYKGIHRPDIRVMPNPLNPRSAGYPTIEAFLQAEYTASRSLVAFTMADTDSGYIVTNG